MNPLQRWMDGYRLIAHDQLRLENGSVTEQA